VAAEVLEVRAQLSAGAAAVHAALVHAALHTPAVKSPPVFQASAGAVIGITGHPSADAAGTAFIPHFTESVGSKVSLSFTFSFSDNGTPATVKGTFRGTVRQIDLSPPATIYGLDTTGGKATLTEKAGGKTIKATAIPAPSLSALVLNDTGLQQAAMVYTFSATAKGGFAGKTLNVNFGPGP
jgi:hypothetical protein